MKVKPFQILSFAKRFVIFKSNVTFAGRFFHGNNLTKFYQLHLLMNTLQISDKDEVFFSYSVGIQIHFSDFNQSNANFGAKMY